MIGTGILKGMAVTARNFVGSYFEKDQLITVRCPEGAHSAAAELSQLSVPNLHPRFGVLLFQSVVATALRAVLVKFSPGMDSP